MDSTQISCWISKYLNALFVCTQLLYMFVFVMECTTLYQSYNYYNLLFIHAGWIWWWVAWLSSRCIWEWRGLPEGCPSRTAGGGGGGGWPRVSWDRQKIPRLWGNPQHAPEGGRSLELAFLFLFLCSQLIVLLINCVLLNFRPCSCTRSQPLYWIESGLESRLSAIMTENINLHFSWEMPWFLQTYLQWIVQNFMYTFFPSPILKNFRKCVGINRKVYRKIENVHYLDNQKFRPVLYKLKHTCMYKHSNDYNDSN